MTAEEVRKFARAAHRGQTDKFGRDYFQHHVEPIARRLEEHGELAVMAGLLHDVIEDTRTTEKDLLDIGVPADVVTAVLAVSRRPGESYEELIKRAAADPLGRVVKLADKRSQPRGKRRAREGVMQG